MWRLNRDEQRILIITFVGGVGSLLVSACIIGGAIAIARLERDAGLWRWAIVTAVYLLTAVVWQRRLRRFQRRYPGHLASQVGRRERIVIAAFSVGAALTLLVWIGLAAGVH